MMHCLLVSAPLVVPALVSALEILAYTIQSSKATTSMGMQQRGIGT